MNKKYQVFVSSTYEDLVDERKAISQALLESDCIPAGMELFPGSNKQSWDIIKKAIEDSDYYLLIISGRYGSTMKIGRTVFSYTEREFNYANKIGKPILAFINRTPVNEMLAGKVEDTPEGKVRLINFQKKVMNSRIHVAFWTDTASLISEVKSAILHAIRDTPTAGWIKGSELGSMNIEANFEKYNNIIGRWGIEKIFRTRAEKNAESDLLLESHNIKELDGIAFGLRSFRTSRGEDVLKCLLNGANMRLLIMDPTSNFLVQRAIEENEQPDSVKKSIVELTQWVDILNQKSNNGKIQIKYYNCMTLDFYWRVDDFIYVGPYWYDTLSQQTITYKFRKPGLGYSQYFTYFEKLWNLW